MKGLSKFTNELIFARRVGFKMRYDKDCYQDRLSLADVRCRVTSKVVSTGILINAVPLSLRLIFVFPAFDSYWLFWLALLVGWSLAGASVACGVIFEALVPRWVRGATSASQEKLMDFCYPASILLLGLSSISFLVAVSIATLGRFELVP